MRNVRLTLAIKSPAFFNAGQVSSSQSADQSLPFLIGDKRRFQQVLINLLKNATKYTQVGLIQVIAAYDEQLEKLMVSVKDTGNGILGSEIPKLFSRFGKLHRTAEMNNEGIGLGLTIVKGIVK